MINNFFGVLMVFKVQVREKASFFKKSPFSDRLETFFSESQYKK
jgi:hypothetical protein